MITEKHLTESVLATIVLYNTSLEQSESFVTLSRALSHIKGKLDVLVYDNSPSMMYTGETYSTWNIHYVHDAMNSGISKAYNTAFDLAKKLEKKWLLLSDQDTSFPEETFAIYSTAIEDNDSTGLLAPTLIARGKIISPFKPGSGKGKILQTVTAGSHSFNDMMPVNSGLMVRLKEFQMAGGYDEAFPLDYSDLAFIHRYQQVQSNFVVVPLVCEHQFAAFNPSAKKPVLKRFKQFCTSTLLFKQRVDPRTNARWIILSHALKLTIRFKSPVFLKMALTILFRGL